MTNEMPIHTSTMSTENSATCGLVSQPTCPKPSALATWSKNPTAGANIWLNTSVPTAVDTAIGTSTIERIHTVPRIR
ncbi:hypothetical protein AAV33_05990 [Corynebacterium otitidis]|nr:hypothetical protein AAV33_05990 [Corynebacterium otitidis]